MLCHQALLTGADVWGLKQGWRLGKPRWGEQGRELPPDLRWDCWCCCCDLLKLEGLIWLVAEYIWSC